MNLLLFRVALFFGRFGFVVGMIQFVLLYVVLAILLPYAEGETSAFQDPVGFTYYFFTVVATVGLGDIVPKTDMGRILTVCLYVFGIGSFTMILVSIASINNRLGEWFMSGDITFKGKKHVIIFGYHKGETENLIREIRGDMKWKKCEIVLCSSRLEKNPLPEEVVFIKGELHTDEVMKKANIQYADKIIIDGHDDSQCMAVAVTVLDLNDNADIVVHAKSKDTVSTLKKLKNNRMTFIEDMNKELIVQEMQNPGISAVIRDLLSHQTGDQEFYRVHLPMVVKMNYGELLSSLKIQYDALVIAVCEEKEILINPSAKYEMKGGQAIFVIAKQRLNDIKFK
jgi:voltage-gated potassium channel